MTADPVHPAGRLLPPVVLVAGDRGWVSYLHGLGSGLHPWGAGLVDRLYPGTVDGLIYMSSMVPLDAARRDRPRPRRYGTVHHAPGCLRGALKSFRRCLGERGFALLTGRWRTLRHITASPSKIGDITRAALVLTQFEHKYIT